MCEKDDYSHTAMSNGHSSSKRSTSPPTRKTRSECGSDNGRVKQDDSGDSSDAQLQSNSKPSSIGGDKLTNEEILERLRFSDDHLSECTARLEGALKRATAPAAILPIVGMTLDAMKYRLMLEESVDRRGRLDAGKPTEITSDQHTIELRLNAIRRDLGIEELEVGPGSAGALPASEGTGEPRRVVENRALVHDGEQEAT